MFEIVFYQDEKGREPVREYFDKLSKRTDKNSVLNNDKIRVYMNVLKEKGKLAGKPYIDHIDGDIWELRPLRNRVLFAAWDGNKFILLHHFIKKTRKTPKKEIEIAKRRYKDAIERRKSNEKKESK